MRTERCAAADPACIDRAVRLLEAGELVALPTDTVYGLAALAEDDGAIGRVFAVKERPPDRPLPIFVDSVDTALAIVDLTDDGERLARAFWPGALTIVANRRPRFTSRALLGGETVGVRIPAHGPVLDVLRRLGRPLAVTSANRSGAGSLATAGEVEAALAGLIPLIVDGGRTIGVESTIVDITTFEPKILRDGAIPRVKIAEVLRVETARL